MTLTGKSSDLYHAAMTAADAVRLDIESSTEKLRELRAYRLGDDEKKKKAWGVAREGLERALAVHRSLCELARQLKAIPGEASLNASECALFSYVKDEDAVALTVDLT